MYGLVTLTEDGQRHVSDVELGEVVACPLTGSAGSSSTKNSQPQNRFENGEWKGKLTLTCEHTSMLFARRMSIVPERDSVVLTAVNGNRIACLFTLLSMSSIGVSYSRVSEDSSGGITGSK